MTETENFATDEESKMYKQAQRLNDELTEAMCNFRGNFAGCGHARMVIREAATVGGYRGQMGYNPETIIGEDAKQLLKEVRASRRKGTRRKKGGKRK